MKTMTRISGLVFALLLVACGGGAASSSNATTPAAQEHGNVQDIAENWRTITPEGEGFSVEVPFDAQMQVTDVGNGIMQHQFVSAPASGEIAYMIGVVHRGQVATAEETPRLLQAAYDAMAHAENTDADAPQAATLNGASGIAFSSETRQADGSRMVFLTQMFVHGDKFIQFLVVLDAAHFTTGLPDGAARFIRSARLI